MGVYLCNYDTTANWEAMAEERLTESFTDINDFASPQCLAVLMDESLIPLWLDKIKKEVVEWMTDMEQPPKECRWHCKGWEGVSSHTTKREAIYELLEVQDLYAKTFKTPEPIAIAVIREVVPWTP